MKHPYLQPTSVFLSVLFLMVASLSVSAKNTKWTGASSVNWSDSANWDLGTPVDNDNVYLTSAGSFQPTNQDLPGLSINNLFFGDGTTTASIPLNFTITGQTLAMKLLNAPTNTVSPETRTYQFDIPLVMTGAAAWNVQSRFTIVLNGGISENGVAFSFGANNNGNIQIKGPNTCTGGFRNNQAGVSLYGQETIGTTPAAVDPDYFYGSNGNWNFLSPDGNYFEYTIPAEMGLHSSGNPRVDVKANTVVHFYGLLDNQTGQTNKNIVLQDNRYGADGWLHLHGGLALNGITVSNGLVIMHTDIAAPPSSTGKVEVGFGTLDLNGHDILSDTFTRNLVFGQSSGDYSVGNIINSNESTPSTINANVSDIGINNDSLMFGGRGDILFTGAIADTAPAGAIDKAGPGTLTISGTNTTEASWEAREGTLVFDYSINNGEKISDSKDISFNKVLKFSGNASAPTVETIRHLRPGKVGDVAGAAKLILQSGPSQAVTLRFTDFERSANAALDFQLDANAIVAAANSTLTNATVNGTNDGILTGAATWNGESFARVSTTDIGSGYYQLEGLPTAAYTINDFGDSGEGNTAVYNKVDVSGTPTIADTEQVAHLRFNDGSGPTTLTLSSSLTMAGNKGANGAITGILVTPNVGANSVTIAPPPGGPNGQLGYNNVNTRLWVHQYNTAAPLRIDSPIFNFTAGNYLAKAGPGELILTNVNNNFPDFLVNEGVVTFKDGLNTGLNNCGIGPIASGTLTISNATLRFRGADLTIGKTWGIAGEATIEVAGTQLDDVTPTGLFTITSNIARSGNASGDLSLTLAGAGQGHIQGSITMGALCPLNKTGSGKWTIDGDVTSWAKTSVLEGTLEANGSFTSPFASVVVAEGATLMGTPNVTGTMVLEGTLAPGDSAGTADIGWALQMGLNSTLAIELGGTSAGQFDVVNVSGEASLNGNLNVSLIDGYAPTNGDSFVVLTAGTITGDFAGADLPNGFSAVTDPIAGTVTITYSSGGSTYASWAAGGNVGPADADDDGDGLLNGIEYSFGFDPKTPNANSAALASLTGATVNVSSNLQFAYQRPATLPSDVTIAVRLSNDLMGWTNGVLNTDYTETVGGGDPQTVTVTLTADLATYKFARVVYLITE